MSWNLCSWVSLLIYLLFIDKKKTLFYQVRFFCGRKKVIDAPINEVNLLSHALFVLLVWFIILHVYMIKLKIVSFNRALPAFDFL